MEKTVLSFFCDDTSPYGRPADAFKTFLDFISAEGAGGESTVLLAPGSGERTLSQPTTDLERRYVQQVRRAFDCGIDTHMEVMTHGGVYDFERGCVPEGVIHEGLWLHEPDVSVATYESYLGHIIEEGERAGIRFTGFTWPGCGCEACTKRYAELRERGITDLNPNVWQALLNLARRGKFRGPTVPCFVHGREQVRLMAADGKYAVYDMPVYADDWFGIWENDPARVNADYYIAADGRSGRFVEIVKSGAPYCFYYCHWQGANPADGVGWKAFQEVIRRVNRHLSDRVEWMRPSEFTDRWHQQH